MAGLEQYLNNPNVRKMLDLISYTEHTQGNGYYTAFGGGRLSSLADHPRYRKPFRQTDGKINYTSAAGKYQFLKSTWDGLARKYGFSDFSPQNQDLGAVALLIQRGAMPHLLKGDFANAIAKSGAEWASLPTSPHPQPTKSWKQVNAFLGGKIQVPQNSGQVAPQPMFADAVPWSKITGKKQPIKQQPVLDDAVPWSSIVGEKSTSNSPQFEDAVPWSDIAGGSTDAPDLSYAVPWDDITKS